MRNVWILSVAMLLAWSIPFATDLPASADVPRSVTFIDVGSSKFDSTSAPSFISAADWNDDGSMDLLFNGHRLFRNNGPPDWSFTLMTSTFQSTTSGASNGAWADWDGDGDQDLYQACGKGTADRFWENQGPPGYELMDVSSTALGAFSNVDPSTGSSWGDYDMDGDLDLYVGNGEDWNDGDPITYPDHMLRNENGTSFTDVTSAVGMRTSDPYYTRGVTWGDFNNDHWQDVYISHYRIRENLLFVNQHDGTFTEEGQIRNCSGLYDTHRYYDTTTGQWYGPMWGHTIGSSWADFNRDGNLDLFTSDFVHKYVGPTSGGGYDIRGYICDDGKLYINEGAPNYHYTDFRNTSGIPIWPIGGAGVYRGDQTFAGVTVGDYDNDGWEDLYIPQVYADLPYTTPHMYHNKGPTPQGSMPDGTVFEDVTNTMGMKGADTYANMYLDYDSDGDLDLITGGGDTWDGSRWTNYRVRLYQNQGTGSNAWLEVDLNGTGKNRDAVGARVVLRYSVGGDERMLLREVRAGTGHAHQQPSVLHFGLGSDPLTDSYIFDSMEVHWPDGLVQIVDAVELNRKVYVDHPTAEGPSAGLVSVSPVSPIEDSLVTITVQASPGDVPLAGFQWDIDADNHFDVWTTAPTVAFTTYEEGLHHVRCRAVDIDRLAGEVYPIEFTTLNAAPVIELHDMYVDMDAELFLPEDAVSDTPSDLRNLTWNVEWGDGSTSQGRYLMNASHSFKEQGTFAISVAAEDGSGPVSAGTKVYVRNVPPWGWVETSEGNGTVYPEDQYITLVPRIFDTVSDTEDKGLRWDFGDGEEQTSFEAVSETRHTYPKQGEYLVRAYVMDSYGAVGVLSGNVSVINLPPVLELAYPGADSIIAEEDSRVDLEDRISASDTFSDEKSLEFSWDLGDGNTTDWAKTPDLIHSYPSMGNYSAVCKARDDDGAEDSLEIRIEVSNLPPEVSELDPIPELSEDQAIEVIVHATDTPSDSKGLTYRFDLGDGRVVSWGPVLGFSYPTSGHYDLTVTVTDGDGASSTVSTLVMVRNDPPSAEVQTSSRSVNEDGTITFMAASLSDSINDMAHLTVSWDMGDGTLLEGREVNYSYPSRGRYVVEMTVSDGDQDIVKSVTVNVANVAPVPSSSASKLELNVSEIVSLSAEGSYDTPSDNGSLSFFWELGDDTTLEGMTVEHQYSEVGTYWVLLTVTDNNGAVGSTELVLTVIGGEGGGDIDEQGPDGLLIAAVVIMVMLAVLLMAALAVILVLRRRGAEPALSPVQVPATYPLPYMTQRSRLTAAVPFQTLPGGAGPPSPAAGPVHGRATAPPHAAATNTSVPPMAPVGTSVPSVPPPPLPP